jgi:hypothetical protein
MILVDDLVLVFQKPVNRWFVVHGFVNCLGHRLTVDVEQRFVVKVVVRPAE